MRWRLDFPSKPNRALVNFKMDINKKCKPVIGDGNQIRPLEMQPLILKCELELPLIKSLKKIKLGRV